MVIVIVTGKVKVVKVRWWWGGDCDNIYGNGRSDVWALSVKDPGG